MFQIGLLQLTQNLDDAVYGFKEGLTKLGVAAQYHYRNADGSGVLLPKLARELAEKNVDLIFACSTPAAAAAQSLPEDIPVVFTPVFDPVLAGLVQSMERPCGKATGMSGMIKAEAKIAFLRELLPRAKKIGMLYHTKDDNACIEAAGFRQAARGALNLTEIPIGDAAEISLLEEKLSPDLDALFLPIGKIIEENFSSVAYYADAHCLPILASHAPNVVMGALGALVADHAALGGECAVKAKEILCDHKNPGEIPVGVTRRPHILLNRFAAETLGITFSPALTEKAKEIYT